MLLRIALFALMAVGLLGFGAVAWVSTHPASSAPPPAVAAPASPPPSPVKVMVTVAAHSLRAGSFLQPDDLRGMEMDAGKPACPDPLTSSHGLQHNQN